MTGASALKPVVVCASCNNGWISTLEKSAHRLLTAMVLGHMTTLTKLEVAVVATWAVKTALVFELLSEGEPVGATAASAEDQAKLRELRCPLRKSNVWLSIHIGSRPV